MFLFQYEIAIVTEEGVEIIGPLSSETNWDIAHMVRWVTGASSEAAGRFGNGLVLVMWTAERVSV